MQSQKAFSAFSLNSSQKSIVLSSPQKFTSTVLNRKFNSAVVKTPQQKVSAKIIPGQVKKSFNAQVLIINVGYPLSPNHLLKYDSVLGVFENDFEPKKLEKPSSNLKDRKVGTTMGKIILKETPEEEVEDEEYDQLKESRLPKSRKFKDHSAKEAHNEVLGKTIPTDLYENEYLRQDVPKYFPKKTIEDIPTKGQSIVASRLPVQKKVNVSLLSMPETESHKNHFSAMKMPIYPIMGKAQILKNGDFRELKLENFIE